ncbi:MAG: hypothetical protein FWC79_07300 [Oscillospiraceae bacterium]|nr:hypothetical protein [Oscillospiraceae bacterium]
MELGYPLVLYIGVPITLLMLVSILIFKKRNAYKRGSKVANTKYIKNTPHYKSVLLKYRIWTYGIIGVCTISIFLALFILARPARVEVVERQLYSRDIFISMNVNSSMNDINEHLMANLIDMVSRLEGERIGITLFNLNSVLLIPLTDDYGYVLDVLHHLGESLMEYNDVPWEEWGFGFDYPKIEGDSVFRQENPRMHTERDWNLVLFIMEGLSLHRGQPTISSAGEGLATTIFSFPDSDEERTRIVILISDNELRGNMEPIITTRRSSNNS